MGTHRQIPSLPQAQGDANMRHGRRVLDDVRAMWRNRSFRALFLGMVLFFIMRGMQSALGLHAATFFWELTPQTIQFVMLAILLGFLAGVPFANLLSRLLDKKWIFFYAIVWALSFHTITIVLRLCHLLPDNGDPMLVMLLVLAAFIGGLGAVQALVAGGSMIADITDEHHLATGRRQAGMFFGSLAFASKAASGLGHSAAGIGIDLIHLPLEAQPGDVVPEALWKLGFVYGPGVALLGLVALGVFSRYSLTRSRVAAVQTELHRRRNRTRNFSDNL